MGVFKKMTSSVEDKLIGQIEAYRSVIRILNKEPNIKVKDLKERLINSVEQCGQIISEEARKSFLPILMEEY